MILTAGFGKQNAMAIVKVPVPTRKVLAGETMITVGKTGSQVMQKSTNNRAKGSPSRARQLVAINGGSVSPSGPQPQIPSAVFTAIDEIIFGLDGAFDQLPVKIPWIDYAIAIDGDWQLCANCMPDSGAKKLYRQYNFWRSALNMAGVVAPVDATAFAGQPDLTALWFVSGGGAVDLVEAAWNGTSDNNYVCGQTGRGLRNPLLQLNPLFNGVLVTSGPIWEWVREMANSAGGQKPPPSSELYFLTICNFDLNGAPGLNTTVEIEVVQNP